MRRQIVQVTGRGVAPDEFGNRTEQHIIADAEVLDNGTLRVTVESDGEIVRRVGFAPGQWDVVDIWVEDA